jgi:uncharacterized membrane protein YedE/YeeE
MLIGLAGALLLLFNGRIAGISGIVDGLTAADRFSPPWRIAFLLGLVFAGVVAVQVAPASMNISGLPELPQLIAAGVLVGVGTRVGRGCTSGHGVCGISRWSLRSIVATVIFVATAMLTVFLVKQWFGGAS